MKPPPLRLLHETIGNAAYMPKLKSQETSYQIRFVEINLVDI